MPFVIHMFLPGMMSSILNEINAHLHLVDDTFIELLTTANTRQGDARANHSQRLVITTTTTTTAASGPHGCCTWMTTTAVSSN